MAFGTWYGVSYLGHLLEMPFDRVPLVLCRLAASVLRSACFLVLRVELFCNLLEVADCPPNDLSADSFSLAEVPEHRQGSGEFVAEQVAELLYMVKILR